MARPRKAATDQRSMALNIRVTRAEYMAFAARAAVFGLSTSAYARTVMLGQPLPASAADQQAQAELRAIFAGVANNLNQVTKHANAGKGLLEGELRHTLHRVNECMDGLYDSPPRSRRRVVQGRVPLLPP